MQVVGLTGGIACGKSTVARILRDRGVPVLDADLVAREVVAPGTPGLTRIVEAFGAGALAADGTLDRPAMRQRIASEPGARRALEAITHPEIYRVLAERIATLSASGHPAAVVEAALMVETGSYRMYEALIVVSCDPERQLARIVARDGVTEDQAKALIATQLPMAEKEKVATHVIRNDGTPEELEARTLAVWSQVVGPD